MRVGGGLAGARMLPASPARSRVEVHLQVSRAAAASAKQRRATNDGFARAALGAFALWRFTPMIQAGCPVRANIRLGSRFATQ